MRNKIINYIKKNRVSTTEIADALSKKGSFLHLKPIDYQNSLHKTGKIKCIFAYNNSNYLVHKDAKKVCKDDVVLIFTHECGENSIIGDLISKYLILYKEAAAIAVMGNVRDLPKLTKERYPIWCRGFNPVGVVNNFTGNFPKKIMKEILSLYEGGIAVCDLTGVVAIKKRMSMKKLLKKLNLSSNKRTFGMNVLIKKSGIQKK